MTEEEWLKCSDPIPMLEFLRDRQRASSRKLRLFSVACCRRIWPFLTEECSRKFVEMTECFADGIVTREDMIRAANEFGATVFASNYARPGAKVSIWYAAGAVGYAIVPAVDPETDNVAWATAAAMATEELDWSDPLWDRAMRTAYTSGGYKIEDEEHWAEVWGEAAYVMRYNSFTSFPGWHAERKEQAAIVRDIFGNPFRHEAVDPSWLTWQDGTVPKLGQSIYDNRILPARPLDPAWLTPTVNSLAAAAYDERSLPSGKIDPARLAVLADALEDAGCTNADILAHCRAPGPHVRGCWVIDLLLGRE